MCKIVYGLNGTRIKAMDELQEFLSYTTVLSASYIKRIMSIVDNVMVESYNAGKKDGGPGEQP
jgi:hypothetical protein